MLRRFWITVALGTLTAAAPAGARDLASYAPEEISALQRRYQLDGQILKDVLISLRKMEDEICASILLERHQLLEQVRRMMWE